MPSSVVDLFACRWTGGSAQNTVVWKMMSSWLLWYLWREINNRYFEDHKRMLEEFNFYFLNSLKFGKLRL
jgi:hypothetical protein